MSLPLKTLSADLPQIPTWPGLVASSMGEIPLGYASKQVPLIQMERLLDQLASFSTLANHIFLDLANQTLAMQQRIHNVSAHLDNLKTQIPAQLDAPQAVQARNFLFTQVVDGLVKMELPATCSRNPQCRPLSLPSTTDAVQHPN